MPSKFFGIIRRDEKRFKKGLRRLGPGIITGGADNDPAGIVTYTTIGATTGFSLLWLLLLCTPMMIVAQDMAARIALVTKKGLSSVIKKNYGSKIAVTIMTILVVANIATIGADIAGVAAVLGLVTGINWLYLVIPVTVLIWYLILFKTYKTIKKVLIGLTALLGSYILSAIFANPNWSIVFQDIIAINIIPTLGFIAAAVGLIGTTISPYMLFWQASDELEEHKTILKAKEAEFDTALGMSWSNVIAAFIIIAAGATLFAHGVVVETVEQAALALQPLAGQWSFLLFTFGVVIAGFLSIPVLAASTAYATSETFGWREGLGKKFVSAKGFYIIITASLLVGMLIALTSIPPVLFLFYTQILDGLLMPFLILILLFLTNNKKIMGRHTNTRSKNFTAIILLLVLSSLDVLLLSQLACFL